MAAEEAADMGEAAAVATEAAEVTDTAAAAEVAMAAAAEDMAAERFPRRNVWRYLSRSPGKAAIPSLNHTARANPSRWALGPYTKRIDLWFVTFFCKRDKACNWMIARD
jgi:hypothetical protein